jgi:hypothetical protein
MARNRSVNLLPEIYKTNTNKEFLNSTLDQLTQEPKLKQTQGFIGRTFGKGVESDDVYIIEPTNERVNYQLEPGIITKDENANINEAITYPEILDALNTKGANVSRHDRLFSSQIYSWSPLIDFDKFVNHSQYYWLPSGPNSVDVSATETLLTDDFDVTRNEEPSTYSLSGVEGVNPSITLVRGGEYTFKVNQTGNNFYIQTEPGTKGTLSSSSNISSRDIIGVTNNGEDNGTITFAVPSATNQQFYYDLADIDDVDLATFDRFDDINGKTVNQLKDIDGVIDMEGKTIVFLNPTAGDSADLGWQYKGIYAGDITTYIDTQADRYSVYKIEYVSSDADGYDASAYDGVPYDRISPTIKLNKIKTISNLRKFDILYGETYSNKSFYKNSSGYFQEIPLLSASHDTLYYQDATDESKFGIINLINSSSDVVINIDANIVGKKNYTSNNGVVFTNGLKVIFRGDVNPSTYQDTEYYVEGVGDAIKLINALDLITPEEYTTSKLEPFDFNAFDATNFDGDLNSPTELDFITINKASNDLNPWSRSNRWVHKDVIEKTASYNNTVATFDNDFRASRPIIEFHANLKLFNFGTESKTPVTVIDFNQVDAFSNINGSSGFAIDRFNITDGARVIFAKDSDEDVRNKIYEVRFVDLEGNGALVVSLVPTADTLVSVDHSVVCTNGASLQGNSYHYSGSEWIKSQQKTTVNQSPLFDVYDTNGIGLADSSVYKKSSFNGTKMFSYGVGNGTDDKVLGFPLTFLNIDNLGDIVFNNDLYTDTFVHDTPPTTTNVSNGSIRKYSNRTSFDSEVGWTTFVHDISSEQIFNFEYDGVSLVLDVIPMSGLKIPSIKVYIADKFINSNNYTVSVSDYSTVIKFNYSIPTSTKIKVTILSNIDSKVGYYNIPKNLENNPFNENSDTLTLGTIRHHYTNLAQNLLALSGDINGSNNSRDLGSIENYGDTIIQNSSPIVSMAKFLSSDEFDLFESIDFNANAYEKTKLKILDYVSSNDTQGMPVSVILDGAMESLNIGKSLTSPFYKSDMLAGVSTPTITNYEITAISTSTFNIINIYDFTKANNKCLLVYLNNSILVKDSEYVISTDAPTITVLVPLSIGDNLEIKEFETTIGSYVPNTPTKLGLHPKYQPRKFLDDTFTKPVNVIQGHDGSILVAHNDIRDEVMLEFESRIFNNIKIDSKIPLRDSDVIPGKFRTTEYTNEETTDILSNSFLNWVGWNRLDYKTQDFLTTNELTWNYSTCSSKLDNTSLKGHWRAVYKHYYDTDTPHTTPWEMLGITEKPTWWEDAYGIAPYTNGNLVLWDDLASGLIKEPGNNRIDTRYKRVGLTKVIPVDSEGKLLNPFVSLVKNYSKVDFKKSWVIGDCGPTENTWRRSSSYPFALQRLLALTKPAQYFALSIDRDRYAFDNTFNQYLMDSRYRLDVRNIEVQTSIKPKHSYINWIADYHNNNGCSCVDIKDQMAMLDVRLCYRMASFTDKKYLKIYTGQSSPDSSNDGLLLPDQSYDLLLHKNQALTELHYSSVIVQKTDGGYSVHGHSRTQPYFKIYKSVHDSLGIVLDDYTLPTTFTDSVTSVPYGYVFTNKSIVIDFLVSYGAYLESRGMAFITTEKSIELTWAKMAEEFLSWAAQDWAVGGIINLNPSAISLEFNKELLIVDAISKNSNDILDQNGIPLAENDYVIDRLDNSFKITTVNDKSINFLRIKSVSYEHLMVLDNVSVFNDLLYEPTTGLRQHRVKLVGFTTFDWNGQLDAQGFILNQDDVPEWKANTFYSMGVIVKFKNSYWSAIAKLEPSETFSFSKWEKIDYNSINKGLLPNLSTKAGQISEYYNKKTTNLESDVDLLAMGLTGFRPRAFLASLDDVSQVNFYTDFIAGKGTPSSSNVFRNVKFNEKVIDYEIFENWAIKEATFGNSGNKIFIELELDSSRLQNNPSIIEVVENSSDATISHQIIKVNDIYNQSVVHSSSSIFPVLSDKITDTNFPTAGYVKTADVDIALFDITDFNGAPGIPFVRILKNDSLVWVANDSNTDWNVYIAKNTETIHSIVVSGDDKLDIKFYNDYSFSIGDELVFSNINSLIDGYYTVDSVVDSKHIRVIGTYDNAFVNVSSDTSLTSDSVLYTADFEMNGSCFKLSTVRYPTIGILDNAVVDLAHTTKVWIDSNENKKWSIWEKNVDSGIWESIQEEQDSVDVSLINRAILFDKLSHQTITNLDYIDPINGKILGTAQENIDYFGALDPASYNNQIQPNGIVWGDSHVGNIWWNTRKVRFLDCNQPDLHYASQNWGTMFPGSTIDINQWVKSSTHPTQYKGPGSVVDVDTFTTVSHINVSDIIVQYYYFWVSGIDTIHESKKLSTTTIKQYIETPMLSGIPYVSFLSNSTISIYNAQQYIDGVVIHVSYNRIHNENEIFNEYSLIKENNKNDFLSDNLYKKLQDSFSGGNAIGLSVPDKKLSIATKIGIGYRPRQSMFDNRLTALQEYLTQVNSILKKHIIATNKSFKHLQSEEVIPGKSTNKWNLKVETLNELNYQNLDIVDIGYKYLVSVDTDNSGGWSIYEVIVDNDGVKKLLLIQIQTYDTTRAWAYIDWYENTDAEIAIPTHVVSDSSQLVLLVMQNDAYVKVTSNSNGKFEIYQSRNGYWVRVGLEDGTIKFNESLWSGKSTQDNITLDADTFTSDSIINTADTGTGGKEIRNVIKAINEDLLTDDLLIHRNKILISVFNFVLSEQGSVDWLTKTSFVDVEYKVRNLEQYSTYKKDDQEFLLNYLNESKPYHTKIKEFLLKYAGTDQYNTDVADFDVPAYYDNSFNKYINPILDYDGAVLRSDQSNFDDDGVGLTQPDYNIWKLTPWDNWYNNRALSIKKTTIVNAGSGYTKIPSVTVTGGGATTQATISARINNSGQLISIVVDEPGTGYITTPTITVTGGHGIGAVIVPVMQNLLVRNLKTTLKYDRCEYSGKIVEWTGKDNLTILTTVDSCCDVVCGDVDCGANVITIDSTITVDLEVDGQLVRYKDVVYRHKTPSVLKAAFNLDDFILVDPDTLTGSERILGFYVPTANSTGLNLAMLMHGIDYPGVLVNALDFNNSAGFSVLPFDTDPFDIIDILEDGSIKGNIDTEYNSSFNDLYLGTKPEDIDADGGNFIDLYSSHSPEELIPSSIFDTLSMTVNTRPGFDYDNNGHSFESQYKLFDYTPTTTTFSFGGIVEHLVSFEVINATTKVHLYKGINYTTDWGNKTITITSSAFSGDAIQILAYEIGGGNQLYRNTFIGDEIGNRLIIPVESQSIYDIIIHVNGTRLTSGYTATSDGKVTVDSITETADSTMRTADSVNTTSNSTTTISFINTYTSSDFVVVTVMGFETLQHDYSLPITSVITPIGSDYDLGSINLSLNAEQNAVVEHNGLRLRPPEGIRYVVDSSPNNFVLPTTGDVNHSLVSTSEIIVFANDIRQVLNVDYTIASTVETPTATADSDLDNADSNVLTTDVDVETIKKIEFIDALVISTVVDVYITTMAEYTINSSILNIAPSITITGLSNIAITTWNDPTQLDLLTSVFYGPTSVTTTVQEMFDNAGFDMEIYDRTTMSETSVNLFALGREVYGKNRLWVTKNGRVLTANVDYIVSANSLLVLGDVINPTDVVVVTSITSGIVPDKLAFRLFKDMNGNSAMYKVDESVMLTTELLITDDVIYLNNAENLTSPNLELGVFGIILINNERITYRELDSATNTISGLRRGTAGTSILSHLVGDIVSDVSVSNIVNGSVITSTTLGADTNALASTYDNIWYAKGINAPSNGIPLQDQVTTQANFIKTKT